MTFQLTARQEQARQLMRGSQRHTCLVGGARSGKTFLLVRQVLTRAIRAEKSRHAILRYRFNAVRASVWLDTLPKVAATFPVPVVLHPKRQDGYVELDNGSQIWMSGLDEKERVDKILGQEYSTLFFNECSQIPYASVLTARTRLAQNIGLPLKAFYDLNPTGKGHWTNRLFGEHRDPQTLKALSDPDQYKRMFLNPRDNAENLPAGYLGELEGLPDRQRRRFYEGVYVDEVDGALWTLERIEECRCEPEDVPELRRVVVAVDPSGTRGDEDGRSDAIGIIVAGLGIDGNVYVIEDLTCQLPPAGWGRRVVEAYGKHQADRVVAEQNFGGEMVRYVIETADRSVPVHMVTASRGKSVRAEPVSALYEQGKVRHVGRFPELEDQMLSFSTAGYGGDRSPDRADALVWALSDLMVGGGPLVFESAEDGFLCDPVKISAMWKRVAVVVMNRSRFVCLWGALDRSNDVLYLYDEISGPLGQLAVHAEAMRARGQWIPVAIDMEGNGRTKDEGSTLVGRLLDLRLDVFTVKLDLEAGLGEVNNRLATNRLRVLRTLPKWLGEYRRYQRDAKLELDDDSHFLMQATALLCLSGIQIAITENTGRANQEMEENGFDYAAEQRNPITGY